MSFFELIAAPGNGDNAQERPNGKQSRKNPPVRVQDLNDVINELGDISSWKQLTESGPEHSHAPVHVPSKMQDTVLKEYPLSMSARALGEAQRLNAASEYMPKVHGMYENKAKERVYIHMEKLEETVMARIRREGADFLLRDAEKQKFYDLWNMSKLYDGSSMCRVDNMMYDADGTLKFIDAEKAIAGSIKDTGLLSESQKESMKECFVNSAAEAHVVHLANNMVHLDLKIMGELYHTTGGLLNDYSWLRRNFTREIGLAVLRWFDEGYENAFISLRETGFAFMRALREKYDLEDFSEQKYKRISLMLDTTFLPSDATSGSSPSFVTIRLRLPPSGPY